VGPTHRNGDGPRAWEARVGELGDAAQESGVREVIDMDVVEVKTDALWTTAKRHAARDRLGIGEVSVLAA
jgi:MoxR-like ATPase